MTQLLEDAKALRDLFADRPECWIQGDLYQLNDEGEATCYCLLGGIDTVCGYDFTNPPSYHENKPVIDRSNKLSTLVASVIAKDYGTSIVPEWNDEPGRTIEEVQEVTRKAVEAAS